MVCGSSDKQISKFKDIGKSKENTTMLKLGVFKTMSPSSDHNGSLQWTISGEGYASISDMHRRYLVVDDIFSAKSTYYTYGVALKMNFPKNSEQVKEQVLNHTEAWNLNMEDLME